MLSCNFTYDKREIKFCIIPSTTYATSQNRFQNEEAAVNEENVCVNSSFLPLVLLGCPPVSDLLHFLVSLCGRKIAPKSVKLYLFEFQPLHSRRKIWHANKKQTTTTAVLFLLKNIRVTSCAIRHIKVINFDIPQHITCFHELTHTVLMIVNFKTVFKPKVWSEG